MNSEALRNRLRDLYRSVFPRDTPAPEDSSPEPVDEASIISDLHMFLVQLARWITDHLEYENKVGRELPSDSGLILRFRLDDYVTETVEFFSRKQLFDGSTDRLFLAGIEVLIPPEHIRDVLPWQIRKQLFGRLLQQISLQTGMPLPVVTRKFYDHLAERDAVNGLAKSQVLESYQEAITDLSRIHDTDDPGRSEPSSPEEQTIDAANILAKALGACGATNYSKLTRILSRRHVLDFVWLVFLYTVAAVAAIVTAEPIVRYLTERVSVPIGVTAWQIVVVVVYLTQLTIRVHRVRYWSNRRKTLIRVSNVLAEELSLSYKEVDDVFQRTYGTSLKAMRHTLLPKARRSRKG